VLSAASIAVTVAMVIGVLNTWHHRQVSRVPGGLINPVHAGVNQVLMVIAAVLVILAAINVVFVAHATVLDSRRPLAVTRSLGATREQVSAGVAAAQLVSALLGAIIGIPAGLGLVAALSRGATAIPPVWELAAVLPGTLLVVTGLAAIPARLGGRRSLSEILQSETA
jgi:putative ABC transport system permease protein